MLSLRGRDARHPLPRNRSGRSVPAVMGLFTAAFLKSHGVETLVVSEPVTSAPRDG